MDHPIERLAPRLAALRIELCPCHMTVGYFWKVYFVLLHSRLGKHDAQLLSSPQVITSAQSYYHHHAPPEFLSPGIYAFEPPSIVYPDFQKTVRWSENVEFIDKAVIEEEPIQKIDKNSGSLSPTLKDDDWPGEEDLWS
ncbi:hypothetical protein Bca101_069452 [Brassica carinata]|uniref:BSD domain-containing protein n=1 Tax=Brassica oleracea var. oleracea TaxID=109376 RepID=A0A0D3C959_BRAOL